MSDRDGNRQGRPARGTPGREPDVPAREPGKRGEDEVRPPAEHPAPGIEHAPEPDAGNIIPAKERPGTL